MIFPELSVSAPNHRPAGDAATPAPQSTVPAGTLCALTRIPSESTLVTRALVKTSTPKLSKWRCALRERTSGYVGRMRGPASYRRIRAVGIYMPKVMRQSHARHFGERAGHLDA